MNSFFRSARFAILFCAVALVVKPTAVVAVNTYRPASGSFTCAASGTCCAQCRGGCFPNLDQTQFQEDSSSSINGETCIRWTALVDNATISLTSGEDSWIQCDEKCGECQPVATEDDDACVVGEAPGGGGSSGAAMAAAGMNTKTLVLRMAISMIATGLYGVFTTPWIV